MTTRLYPRRETAEYVPGSARGNWDDTSQVLNYRMIARKAGSVGSDIFGETSTTNNWDVLTLRFVTDTLTAQTIDGTFDICLMLQEGASTYNLFTHLHVYAVNPADGSVRGTLISDYIDATEWNTTLTFMTLTGGPRTVSAVTCADGDRIVIEFGFQAQNTSATNSVNAQRFGGVNTDAVNSDTTTTLCGWCEFSKTLAFKTTYLFLNDIAAPATPSAWVGAWDDTSVAVSKQLGFSKSGSGACTTQARAETSSNASWDVALGRFVSPKLAAVTISGDYVIRFGLAESSGSADMVPHVHMYVMKPDGTVRGTLISDAIGGSEIATSTTASGLEFTGTFSTVAAEDGDRLVLELGYRATNAVTTSFTGTLSYGGDTGASSGDLTVGANPASANLGGYIRVQPLIPLAGARPEIQLVAA